MDNNGDKTDRHHKWISSVLVPLAVGIGGGSFSGYAIDQNQVASNGERVAVCEAEIDALEIRLVDTKTDLHSRITRSKSEMIGGIAEARAASEKGIESTRNQISNDIGKVVNLYQEADRDTIKLIRSVMQDHKDEGH